MIYGKLSQIKNYEFLGNKILKCFEYANTHDLGAYTEGKYEIDGDNFFVNICEYETTTKENRFWEAHKIYLDIHFMIDGNEQIDIAFIENMKQLEFDEEKDFLALDGFESAHIILNDNDFAIFYPSDAHKTAISASSKQIKKAIFKVKI